MRKPRSEDGPLTELARGFRKRTLVTAKLFAKLGARMARENLGLGAALDRIDEDDAVAAATRLLAELDGLKGLAAKLGQMVSYLDQSLPPKAQRVLARLQSQQRGLPYEAIARVVADELGGPPEQLFDAFEPAPFAAASLGQVHRARLGDRRLAVKVQYPDMERLLGADLALVERFAGAATLLHPVDGKALAREMSARMKEECDYGREAENQAWFRERFQGHPGLSVPEVVPERSARRVLTSELVERAGFASFVAAAPPEARDRAGALIYEACFDTIFRDRVYNADPHPGNYLFAEDGAVTLLDFGCVKRFGEGFIATWKRLALCILDDDRAAFRDAVVAAGFVGRARGFDFEHQRDAMRFLYQPMLAREPFVFTHAFVAEVHDRLVFQNNNKWRLALPPDWLFVNRLQLGLFSVLAELGARARFADIFRAAVESP
jgi:predicted unusual protein kinase regulating ubiquinone biosynthesis (AarF/ABC1/UbiB family)